MKTRASKGDGDRLLDELYSQDRYTTGKSWFANGSASFKNFILYKVVKDELKRVNYKFKDEFTPQNAEVVGRENGTDEGINYHFQTRCRNAYHEAIQRVKRVLSDIVKSEKDLIYRTIRDPLPNMEFQLEQKLNRNEVEKLTEIADKRNKADRKADKFLRERGFDFDSPEAQDAEGYTNWKFWVPLLVILLIELFANYVFLDSATPLNKILISATAVLMVFVCGFGINRCRKRKAGIRTEDTLKEVKNTLWHILVVFWGVLFALTLILFISYRAGKSFATTEIFSQLATAFTNNITDFGLAVLNIVFLFIAITTFRNAECRIHGYDEIASERSERTREHKKIREQLYNQARHSFDEARESVDLRRKTSKEIEKDWLAIKDTYEKLPDMESDAIKTIADLYELTIRKYREGFKKGRFPNDENKEDMQTEIPEPIRLGAHIDILVETDDILQQEATFNINFEDEVKQFDSEIKNWLSKNENFDHLYEVAREIIKKHREHIRQEMQDDDTTNRIEKNETASDE